MRILAILLLGLAAGGCSVVQIGEKTFLHPDDPPVAATGEQAPFSISGAVGTLSGLRIHRPGARSVIFYAGGNDFRVHMSGGKVVRNLPADADIIMFDYPGYGASTGPATIKGTMDSLARVYDLARQNGWLQNRRIVFYGFSLGGFVVARTAAERPADGVVLEASAANVRGWGESFIAWFARPFVEVRVSPALQDYDNAAELEKAGVPVLLLSGGADEQASDDLSYALAGELEEAGVRVTRVNYPGARHGEIMQQPGFTHDLAGFLGSLSAARQ